MIDKDVKAFLLDGLHTELPAGCSLADVVDKLGEPVSSGINEQGFFEAQFYCGIEIVCAANQALDAMSITMPIDAIKEYQLWPKLAMMKADNGEYSFVRRMAYEEAE